VNQSIIETKCRHFQNHCTFHHHHKTDLFRVLHQRFLSFFQEICNGIVSPPFSHAPISRPPICASRPAQLALRLDRGSHGAPLSAEGAFAFYVQAASQGHLAALTNVGVCFDGGRGVAQPNVAAALACFRHAAAAGNAMAMKNIGVLHEQGREPHLPRNHVKAMEWYLQAASQGHALSLVALRRLALQHSDLGLNVKALEEMAADGTAVTTTAAAAAVSLPVVARTASAKAAATATHASAAGGRDVAAQVSNADTENEGESGNSTQPTRRGARRMSVSQFFLTHHNAAPAVPAGDAHNKAARSESVRLSTFFGRLAVSRTTQCFYTLNVFVFLTLVCVFFSL
jgi:hypothetical protein